VVRWLGDDLPSVQSAFLRFATGLVILLPALIGIARRGLPAGSIPIFALRGGFHAAAIGLWFFAMTHIPMAEVTAIGFINPIIVTIGGALFFGEVFALRRLMAIGVAILGAIIVLRPGLREIEPGHFAQIGAAMLFGGSYLTAKRLSQIAPAGVVVTMMSVTVAIILAPFAFLVWQPVTLVQVSALFLVALFATSGHYCMTRAFACAPMTVTQPVTFLQLVWASLLGWLAFGEAVDPYVLLGGAVIIGAISYMTWREAHAKRRSVTPLVGATKG
jgi:drug/metabolite transporter (DMT)-like permease